MPSVKHEVGCTATKPETLCEGCLDALRAERDLLKAALGHAAVCPLFQSTYRIMGADLDDVTACTECRDALKLLHNSQGPCPDDTNGDGNCGKPLCPYCGPHIHKRESKGQAVKPASPELVTLARKVVGVVDAETQLLKGMTFNDREKYVERWAQRLAADVAEAND